MKKLMCAVAALSAGICMADVESANIVGYQTVDSPVANSYKAFAVQFEGISGEAEIPLTKLFTFNGVKKGAPLIQDAADQIWKWDSANSVWVKYFWKLPTNAWAKEDGTVCTDADTIKNGETFFFKRSSNGGAAAATLTLSGAVHELTASKTYPNIAARGNYFMSYPWPCDLKISRFKSFQGNPKGAPLNQDAADQIMRWDSAKNTWIKYFYKLPNNAWARDDGTLCGDDDVIPAGEGFFFKRSSNGGASETITFSQPE